MYIVLIETSGNQSYIFATNKMRENVGASELTHKIGTKIVEDVIMDYPKGVEKIITTSGKALLKVENDAVAKEIIQKVTTKALQKMPGLTVHGAICKVACDNDNNPQNIHEAIVNVHRRLEINRYNIPSNTQRFQRLPFVEPCKSSGLPASKVIKFKDESDPMPISEMAYFKRINRDAGYKRIEGQFSGFTFVEPEDMEKCDWVAVIHADGNGVGKIFLHFNDYSEKNGNDYLQAYQDFSKALETCTISAFTSALENYKSYLKGKKIPIVPLILGGDDLTLLCEGHYALKFTHDFLVAFENQTSINSCIAPIAAKAFNDVRRLGICAGVAIVKPHYPFHQAYDLAEQLLKSAKQVKTKVMSGGKQIPCSALDFHILYDSTHADLDDIRSRITIKNTNENTHLYAKPYVVGAVAETPPASEWLDHRKFTELKTRIETMKIEENDDDKTILPNSKLHEIRNSLIRGKNVADSEAGLIRKRLSKNAQKEFNKLCIDDSLFFTESGTNYTHFLDAIEAVKFWEGFESESVKGSEAHHE